MGQSGADSATSQWSLSNLKTDLPASLVVFLVALPLCMVVAIASGAPVTSGLVTGIVGGIVVGFLAGSPLQVSGPAAGLTVLVYQLIQQHGLEMMGPIVLLAGLFQLMGSALHLAQWFRVVSPAVVQGMLAGIGVLIVASQFHVMVDEQPRANGVQNLLAIPSSALKTLEGPSLGTVEERLGQTEAMHELGLIHLQQTEIAEHVHHLFTGIVAEDGTKPATAVPAKRTPGKRTRAKPAKDAPPTTNEEIATELQALAPQQAEIVKKIEEYNKLYPAPTPIAQQALADCQTALADLEVGDTELAKASVDRAEQSLLQLRNSRKNHRWAAMLGVVTIAIILLWQGVIAKRIKFLPAPFIAVSVATAAAVLLSLPVIYVEVPDNLLEEIYLPSLAELMSMFDGQMLFASLQVAMIASAETLICSVAVDKLHRGPRTKFDRELAAQGVGNMICGLLSALPMTGVIVRSSANIGAGAQSRMSTILHGLWLLILVVLFANLLRMIPTCSLAAVLVYTGYKLINPKAVRDLWRQGKFEVVVFGVTLATIVAVDLLTGILVGIVMAIVKLVYVLSQLEIQVRTYPGERRAVLQLRGSATFLRLPALATALDEVPPGYELEVNVEQLDHIDHASLDLLHQWEIQNSQRGSRLTLDHDSLAARFWRRRPSQENGAPQERTTRQRQVPI